MTARRPISLITGASSGIGAAFARQLAALNHDLVLTARRTDRMEALAIELRTAHAVEVTVLAYDLADPSTPRLLCDALDQRGLQVDWLINNAGYGVPGTFIENDWKTHADFLQVLLTAPSELAWRLLPGMRQRGHGRIINVASLAGHVPAPAGHTLYAASKAYLIKFSQSLALENQSAGVHVSALCPGFTWSEFHDVTGTRDKMDKLPDFMWLTAEEVVRQGIAAVERGDAVYTPGRVNRTIKRAIQLMPDRLAMWLSARESKRYRNTQL
ncbi:SDR family oxidoreductase [Rhodanobacter sp. AS-Z3]|uniref:SDR family NAD(P)-dependent oxidoreductase n=1 Tax=Rhodanobacter sp. AS-Z3 TaxID=3031330 RepID=UPI00247AAD66|nr:SDR family oxidoreductase [Rhodanobacter sp. AS-Z3]WEN13883.1 SDR family oxidoreductase [Rhodanobacter sp. AS-Z3]